jgi:AcrR family transcriptional regulator
LHKATRPVEEEILHVARRLFREKGYAGTTTREIATAAGMRQPSLFHYFKNKEALLHAVALGTVEPVLTFIKTERSLKSSTPVSLYRLIWFDTYHLCTNENVFAAPALLQEMTRKRFPDFWASRDQIITTYKKLIRKGVREKLFQALDLEITTNFIFALGESTISWYLPYDLKMKPAEIANNAARLGLKALLKDNQLINTIEANFEASSLTNVESK